MVGCVCWSLAEELWLRGWYLYDDSAVSFFPVTVLTVLPAVLDQLEETLNWECVCLCVCVWRGRVPLGCRLSGLLVLCILRAVRRAEEAGTQELWDSGWTLS